MDCHALHQQLEPSFIAPIEPLYDNYGDILDDKGYSFAQHPSVRLLELRQRHACTISDTDAAAELCVQTK